ncbi:MAG: hypothetical protein EBQ85_03890 [Proteobacteria bacterium]|nr:hypothetical protein [Pseudomonadota bacterium]
MPTEGQDLLLSWNEECIRLVGELCLVLDREREGLTSFDMEKIINSSVEKSSLMLRLKDKREALRKLAQVRYGKPLSEVSSILPNSLLQQWEIGFTEWQRSWSKLQGKCESNQKLLKHSLKNLELLLGNLKHLFRNPGVYNQSGKRRDLSSSGRVLEGRY